MKKLNVQALGLSVGLLSVLWMLVISLLALGGTYTEAFEAMQKWHYFYDLTLIGVIAGMIEALVWGYISGVLLAWFYNMLSK